MSELLEELGLSEDEVKAKLREADELKEKNRTLEMSAQQTRVEGLCKKWQDEDGKAPAVVAAAREILLSEVKGDTLLLSENGRTTETSFEDAITKLVDASPKVDLSEDKSGGDKEASKGKQPPKDAEDENAFANLSVDVKAEASRLWLEENKPQDEAIRLAKEKFGVKDAPKDDE